MNNQQLHDLYIADLLLPDASHGSRPSKVRRIDVWRNAPHTGGDYAIEVARCMQSNDTARKVWVWSDQHYWHNNIIRYSNRPFADVEDMNNQLLANYNALVGVDDFVLWLGDVAFKNVTTVNEWLDRHNGVKIHIIGNHDINRDGTVAVYNVDEADICYYVPLPHVGIVLTHYPMTNVPDGCINVHGHTHTYEMQTPNHINVSVEALNYRPVLLRDVIKKNIQTND